jgi:hypothetical protein
MKISGHLTESTLERYNIVDSTDLNEAVAKVEKLFKRQRKFEDSSGFPAKNEPTSLLLSIGPR